MEKEKIRLRNSCISVPTSLFKDWSDRKFFKYVESLPYFREKNSSFFVFQREISDSKGEHWQCYFEFSQQVYFKTLQKDFKSAHIEKRKKTQEQAISYCKKEKTRVAGPYQSGNPKKSNRFEKLKSLDKIVSKIKNCEYQNFFEIEEENELIFEENKAFLKALWNRKNPVVFWDTKPARVFWCFGEKGSGKTVWTEKYLRENNYLPEEIVSIFPNSITYNDKIRFEIEDERGRVLVINEVDKAFPKNNNLINFIDRRGFLEGKESKIKNNFELIIINSLYKPEEVFSYLGKRVAGQVLRRIFSPYFSCKVLEIRQNSKQLELFLRNNLTMTNIQFQDWYEPVINEIKEPNYSLIELD